MEKDKKILTKRVSPARLVTVPVMREWLPTKEAMAYLGCARDLLDALSAEGKIERSKLNNKMVYYRKKSIDQLLERSVDNRRERELYLKFANG